MTFVVLFAVLMCLFHNGCRSNEDPRFEHLQRAVSIGIDGPIAMKSMKNGKYVRTHSDSLRTIEARANERSLSAMFYLVDLGNSVVALRSIRNGKYVKVYGSPSYELKAVATSIGTNEKFTISMTTHGKATFLSHRSGLYVTPVGTNTYPLRAVSSMAGTNETFATERPRRIALQSVYTGKLVYPVPSLVARGGSTSGIVANNEMFEVTPIDSSTVALRNIDNGYFVTTTGYPSYELRAIIPWLGTYEKYDVVYNPDKTISLRSWRNNKYVSVIGYTTYPLRAQSSTIGTREKFRIWVDLWDAYSAFAYNFPDKIKACHHTLGNCEMRIHTEEFDFDGWLWLYELFRDDACDSSYFPEGYEWTYCPSYMDDCAPVWNRVGSKIFEGVEYIVNIESQKLCSSGTLWHDGTPRSRRWANISVNSSTFSNPVDKYKIDNDTCSLVYVGSQWEWGKRYGSQLLNNSDDRSQEDMGTRWVVIVEVKNSNELWTIDLGPKLGIFSPRYGVMHYNNGNGQINTYFSNIQDRADVFDRTCGPSIP